MLRRIAYVEDNDETRRAYCRLLRDDGFEVIEYSSKEEALAGFRRELPDLALLDIDVDLPGLATETLFSDPFLIAVPADHGLAMGSHGLLGKQSLYEHSMGCPLIFAGPGVPQGSSDALTYLNDVFPTLAQRLGIDTPDGVFGADLGPVMAGETAGVRDSLLKRLE